MRVQLFAGLLIAFILLSIGCIKREEEEPRSGIILSDNTTRFLIFTEKREYVTSFQLGRVGEVEYVEVTLDLRTTPSDYNELADGNAILIVTLNDKLPYEGDFGLTPILDAWIEEEVERKPREERERWEAIFSMIRRSIILIKEPLGIGSEGIRKVKFDSTALLDGKNILKFLNVEGGEKENEGDGIWIYRIEVFVKRFGE